MDTIVGYLVTKAKINLESQEYIDRDIDLTVMYYRDPRENVWTEDKFKAIKGHVLNDIEQILNENKEKITPGGR